MLIESLISTVFIVHLTIWLATYIFLLTDKYISRQQKRRQLVLAFLIPVLGSLIVIAVNIGFRLKPRNLPTREMGQSIDEHISKHYAGSGWFWP